MQDLPQLKRKEKERRIVGHGSNVVSIVCGKSSWIVACNQRRERIVLRLGWKMKGNQCGMAGKMRFYRRFFLRRKCTLFRQHSYWNSILIQCTFGNHDKVSGSISDSQPVQRFHRYRNYTQRLAWLTELPTRDCDHAIRF